MYRTHLGLPLRDSAVYKSLRCRHMLRITPQAQRLYFDLSSLAKTTIEKKDVRVMRIPS